MKGKSLYHSLPLLGAATFSIIAVSLAALSMIGLIVILNRYDKLCRVQHFRNVFYSVKRLLIKIISSLLLTNIQNMTIVYKLIYRN